MSTTFVVMMMSTFLLYFVVGSLALEGRDGTGLRASVRKPQLWELIHDHYYEGISRSDVEKISQLTLDSSIKHKDEDSSFIMCADRAATTRSSGMTTAALKTHIEQLLGTSLTIIPVNTGKLQVICFHTVTTHSMLEEKGVLEYIDVLHGHPPVMKIHAGIVMMLREGFIDKDYEFLDIVMSTAVSVGTSPSKEQLAANKDHAIRRALSGSNDAHWSPQSFLYGSFASVRNYEGSLCPELSTIISDDDIVSSDSSHIKIRLKKFKSHSVHSCLGKFVENLALNHNTLSIAAVHPAKTLNFEARGIVQSGTAFVEPYSDANLKGQNQILGISDTGVDDLHCFFFDNTTSQITTTRTEIINTATSITVESFRRKVVSYAYTSYSDKIDDEIGGHGTHVSGSAVGSCLTEGITKDHGNAPEAKLAFYDLSAGGESLSIFPSLTKIFDVAKDSGAYISSGSWGSATVLAQYYTSMDAELDQYMYDNEDFLAVFAAGNDGAEGSYTVLSPGYSKNGVTVGSAMVRTDPYDYQLVSQPTISYFSSLGPTSDGRFGIDIVAPGEYIISSMAGDPSVQRNAVDNNIGEMQNMSALSMQGTSMATPTTAGNLILIRQYFMDNAFWNSTCVRSDEFCKVFTPTGSMLKAVLLTSGLSMSQYSCSLYNAYTISYGGYSWFYLTPTPNEFEGFGQLDLSAILPLKKQGAVEDFELFVYDKLTVQEDEVYMFKLSLNESLAISLMYIKVTIAWTDYPDQSGVSNANLVNNIDLQVIVVNDMTSESVTMNYGNDNSDAGLTSIPDTVNPVEQVTLKAVPGYSYEIYVRGATVTTSHQDVSLAMTYPVGGTISGPFSQPSTASTLSKEGPPASSNIPLDWGNSYCASCLSVDFSFQKTLNVNEPTLLASFDAVGDLTLVTYVMSSFDTTYSPLFALIIESPNGIVAQIGGNSTWYYKTEGLYLRRWPLVNYNSWNRYVNGSQLSSMSVNDTWYFYGMLGNYQNAAAKSEYQYSGTIYLEIDDGIYRGPPPSDNDGNSGAAAWVVAVAVIGSILFVVTVCIALYFYCRAARGPRSRHNGTSNVGMTNIMTSNQSHLPTTTVVGGVTVNPVQGQAATAAVQPAPVFGRVIG